MSNEKFRKIHYFANIKYKRNSQKYYEKKFSPKNTIKNFSPKKKFVEKNFRKENLSKIRKKLKK